ncbi:FAD-binding protein [Kosmotoga arenicorallina S304]|uniref:FAD-binding protein n=1 Tax=Kosmotoga arenicorallina S304 TaxID=1453497 RepID=A0A182C867_9BACT|nr:FAD-linked oxidase C-terminal domain-containing protein [Kosmotoga arenicorallina]OAA32520.1 FAD-binding protein [Kosmotoga arenicorallina S304]
MPEIPVELYEKLKEILGNRMKTEEDFLEKYSRDETAELQGSKPGVVLFPISTEEVSQIIRLANEYMIPVTPRGAGTGLSGGAIPTPGGIVLSLEKMNKLIEFDEANLMITVEPGMITSEIQKIAEKYNLIYAGDPCSSESSTIGGNIAENAGGNKVLKYGPTGAHVYGLEVVLPTGEVTSFGGKMVKNVTGLDFVHLLVGSEGTLGIVTKITLRLMPKPRYSVALLAPFESVDAAISAVPALIKDAGVMPSSLEFMDNPSIKLACDFLNVSFPYSEAGAHLILEIEGNDKEAVADEYEKLGDICQREGALEVFVADNRNTREKLWKVRKAIAEALMVYSPVHCMEDVSVPTANIPALLKGARQIAKAHDLGTIAFGHAGDGNVHITFIKGKSSIEHWNTHLKTALANLYELTKNLGGCISGEHGIGLKRKKYLPIAVDQAQIDLIKGIKRVFDPNNILNPGKIIDV